MCWSKYEIVKKKNHFRWDISPFWSLNIHMRIKLLSSFHTNPNQLLTIRTTRISRFHGSQKHSPCTGELREYTGGYMSDSWKPNIRVWNPARSSLLGPSAANSVALLQIDPSVSPSSSSPRRVKVTLEGKGERDIYLQLLSDIRSHSHGEEVTWSSWEEWLYQGRLEQKKCLLLLPEKSQQQMTSRGKMWRRWIRGSASSLWRWTRRSCPWSARLPTRTRCARSCWWAPLPLWLSPRSKWLVSARLCSREAMWTGWPGSCGPCHRVTCSAATKASWKPKPSLLSTRRGTRSCTVFWRTTASARPTTPFCKICGTRPGTPRRRRRGGDPWVPWTSTGSGESTLSPGLSGTARRLCIVSRRGPGTRWRICITRIGTRLLPRKEISPRSQDSPWPRSATGSKTGDSETETRPRHNQKGEARIKQGTDYLNQRSRVN